MSDVAFLFDSNDIIKTRSDRQDFIKIFFSPDENISSYRNFIDIKDIYDSYTYCNRFLKDILDIRINKSCRDWVSIINSLMFIEIFYHFLRGTYLMKTIKRIIEENNPDCIYISKELLSYFTNYIDDKFSYITKINGKGYNRVRWLFAGTIRMISKVFLLIVKRAGLIHKISSDCVNKILYIIQFWRVDSEALIPVIKKCNEKGLGFNLVASSMGAYNKLRGEGFLPVEIESGLSILDIISAVMYSFFLWFKVFREFDRKARQKGMSRTLRRLILYSDTFKPNTIFQFITTLYAIRGIYYKLKPSIIVIADDLHSTGRASCIIAKKMRIPSICLQNGPISVEDYGFIPVFADRFIAWGEDVKSRFLLYGENENRLVVCGSPKYDDLVQNIDDMERYDGEYILYASSMYEDKEVSENIDSVKTVCKSLGRKLLISLHPSMKEDYFVNKLEDRDLEYEIQREGLVSAIKKARLVIVGNSGAGIEAILMGRDLIIFNPGHIDGFIPYAKYGAGFEVYNRDELLEKVRAILSDSVNLEEGRKRFISAYLSGIDGMSSDRILDFIERIKLK